MPLREFLVMCVAGEFCECDNNIGAASVNNFFLIALDFLR
jgi:hypothetical protein